MLLSLLQPVRSHLSLLSTHRTSSQVRKWHALHLLRANPTAARRVPTPLVLLATPGWPHSRTHAEAPLAQKAESVYKAWTTRFGEEGWDAVLIDLGVDEGKEEKEALSNAEAELSQALRKHAAFPPLLIAHGAATLLAQAYVSSAPVSGLILHDAPLSVEHAKARGMLSRQETLEEFDFEPRFSNVCAWSEEELRRHTEGRGEWGELHRLEKEAQEDQETELERVVWELDEKGAKKVLAWAEDEGIVAAVPTLDASSDIGFDDVEEDYEEDEEWEEDVDVAHETSSDTDSSSTPSAPSSTSPPAWFTSAYTFSAQGSKKLPLIVPESDYAETFIRGRGPGGQAINKLSTCVSLIHVPSGTRIVCQETRSRTQNREVARRRMSRMLEELIRGERSVNAKERDKERKKKGNRDKKAKKRARERAEAKKA